MDKKKAKKILFRLGQSTTEYAVLVAVVATALIAMQVYMKRGIQGRIRSLASQLAPDSSGRGAEQYEAGNTNSEYFIEQKGTTTQRYDKYQSGTTPEGEMHTDTEETITRKGGDDVYPDTK